MLVGVKEGKRGGEGGGYRRRSDIKIQMDYLLSIFPRFSLQKLI
jgi:hypothetical protein